MYSNLSLLILVAVINFSNSKSIVKKSVPSFKPNMECTSDCVNAKSFRLCNEVCNYPEELIKEHVMRNKTKLKLFRGNVIEPKKIEPLQFRSSEMFEEEGNMCASKQLTVFPKIALDADMEARYVINLDIYQQSVTFETCLHENQKCKLDTQLLSFETFCKQTYNAVRLWTVNKRGKLEYSKITVPSGCACYYRRKSFF